MLDANLNTNSLFLHLTTKWQMIYYDSSTEFKSLTLNIFQLISRGWSGPFINWFLTAFPTGVSILKNSTVIWKFQLEKLEKVDMIYLLIFNFSASVRTFADDNGNHQQFFKNSSDWISARKRILYTYSSSTICYSVFLEYIISFWPFLNICCFRRILYPPV